MSITTTGIFLLGRSGKLEPVKDAILEIGQIVFLWGYNKENERKAIYKKEFDGMDNRLRYYTVNLDAFKFEIHDAYHIRNWNDKFGIGTYYKDGQVATMQEIEEAIEKTKQMNVVRQADSIIEKEKQRERNEAKNERIDNLLAGNDIKTGFEDKAKQNYSGRGCEGLNYHSKLDLKTIAKLLRNQFKKDFPNSKFSVRIESYSGGQHLYVNLMESDIQVLNEYIGHDDINQFYINDSKKLTEEGKKLFNRVNDLVNSFNYDDSDSQTDYFNVNFYSSLSIGKWDKPYKQIQ